ncbi:MAG: hypothetical protein QXL85_00550 [Candidatus Bathyarchaeia archaeon]
MKLLSRFCVLILILLIISPACCLSATSIVAELNYDVSKYEGAFRYEFVVDGGGNAHTRIIYSSDLKRGSSWVLVPRFIKWVNRTIYGSLLSWTIDEPVKYTGLHYYFYNVLKFDFVSDKSGFEIIIEYDFPLAAMVVESESAHGIFYSPQIGFKPGNTLEAIIIFPEEFKARREEAMALGMNSIYRADENSNSSHIFFKKIPSNENLLRIQIGFDSTNRRVDAVVLRDGIFEFNTVARYKEYAQKVISFYKLTYNILVNIFNVTLESVRARFFVPDFYTLMSIGGYIPFKGGRLGDIYINLMFMRYVEGYLEVVALHEITHHFMWRAGVSPEKLLWFHEGMAQFVSIEVAESIGYGGASMIKEEITESIKRLKITEGSNLKFLTEWTPYYAPREVEVLYASAYYIISELAREHGGLEYYAKFFRLLRSVSLEGNAKLCYYLSLAANRSLFDKFNSWGFNLPDIYVYWPLLIEVENAINNISLMNPFLQPFRKMAETLYWAVISGNVPPGNARLFLSAALFMACNARLIALIVYSCILFFAILIMIMQSRREIKEPTHQ